MFSKDHPDPSKPSMTKHVPEGLTDTNKIVARILRTGQYPPPRPGAMHVDLTQLPGGGDAHAMLSAARAAGQKPVVAQKEPAARPPSTPEVSVAPTTTPSKPPLPTAEQPPKA